MKKHLLNSLLVLFVANSLFAQTTATDFTTNDCNGITHNLFDSLDAGKVIVIAWVMPCTPCATYASAAYDAVQSFATSHSGRVHFYMADDETNTTCQDLSDWGVNNNMPNSNFFSAFGSNSVDTVNMLDYGTPGMPKVVVLGGSDHHIYFNENGNKINFSSVQNTINSALNNVASSTYELAPSFQLNAFPNPTKDKLTVNYYLNKNEEVTFEIVDLLGENAKTSIVFNAQGAHTVNLNVAEISSGNYILKMNTPERTENMRFIISK